MVRWGLFFITFFIGATSGAVAGDTGTTAARIVSLGPLNTENVYLLNAEDLLIANTVY